MSKTQARGCHPKDKYFTAMVNGPTRTNQEIYLRSLGANSAIEIVLGNFKKKTVNAEM
jgi:hypothetical protein